MSENGNESAYPHEDTVGVHDGMTKRERFAMAAMQGAIAADPDLDAREAAEFGVKAADALLAALSGSPTQ